jgi:glycosyltransferase involved in cell wall biosynthesis
MKPLVIVTTFNRLDLTQQTLTSLEPDLPDLDLVIVDNGSSDGTPDWLSAWWDAHHGVRLVLNGENVGCPRALNQALKFRKAGQPVVKLDNDLRIVKSGWVARVARLVAYWRGLGRKLAMVSAYYEPWQQQRVCGQDTYEFVTLYHIWPVVGHAVWHTAEFMDAVGHFDVLSPDHVYGFEDLILSHKANAGGWELLAWEGWMIENIQRSNALGRQGRDAHVEAMRPLYKKRLTLLGLSNNIYTGPDGLPGGRA